MVIKQGDEGDFFYAIVQGKCLVTRESPLNQKGIKLAELGVGETFGEEALIAEAKRNATITMSANVHPSMTVSVSSTTRPSMS